VAENRFILTQKAKKSPSRTSLPFHHSSFTISRPPFIVRRPAFIVRHSSSVIDHPSFTIHHSSFIVHHASGRHDEERLLYGNRSRLERQRGT
jgi:hypothetical protein